MSNPNFSSFGLTLEPVPTKPGWFRGPVTDWDRGKELAATLRASPLTNQFQLLVGRIEGDPGHRIYAIPPIDVDQIVENFRVGARCEKSIGLSAAEAIKRVATRVEGIHHVCPIFITFADSAGLHAEFARKLTARDASEIEKLFPVEDAMKDGLDSYVSEWEGEGPLLAPRLLKEQCIRLWWD